VRFDTRPGARRHAESKILDLTDCILAGFRGRNAWHAIGRGMLRVRDPRITATSFQNCVREIVHLLSRLLSRESRQQSQVRKEDSWHVYFKHVKACKVGASQAMRQAV
jgi:hypothetical protein